MRLLNKVQFIVVHCAGSKKSMDVTKETLRQWHVEENKWDDIGYHYFIKFNGKLFECRDRKYQGAHCKTVNHNSIAICLEGGFEGTDNFTFEQLDRLKEVIDALKIEFPNAALIGHGHIDNKACPSFQVVKWYENQTQPQKPIGFI